MKLDFPRCKKIRTLKPTNATTAREDRRLKSKLMREFEGTYWLVSWSSKACCSAWLKKFKAGSVYRAEKKLIQEYLLSCKPSQLSLRHALRLPVDCNRLVNFFIRNLNLGFAPEKARLQTDGL
jgi:hypothetical protein